MQVLLVTGGRQYLGRSIYLDSTEVLEDMAGTWRLTAPLPSGRYGLRAASVANSIFVFGESFLYYIDIERLNDDIFAGGFAENYLSDILRYNKNHTWEEVGQMKEARKGHAVAGLEDVSRLCP